MMISVTATKKYPGLKKERKKTPIHSATPLGDLIRTTLDAPLPISIMEEATMKLLLVIWLNLRLVTPSTGVIPAAAKEVVLLPIITPN